MSCFENIPSVTNYRLNLINSPNFANYSHLSTINTYLLIKLSKSAFVPPELLQLNIITMYSVAIVKFVGKPGKRRVIQCSRSLGERRCKLFYCRGVASSLFGLSNGRGRGESVQTCESEVCYRWGVDRVREEAIANEQGVRSIDERVEVSRTAWGVKGKEVGGI